MSLFRQFIGLTAAIFLSFAFTVISLAETRKVEITLVLICDIYEMAEQNGRGGYARIASAIKGERARSSNVIVAHAGDAISPSLMSSFDEGKHAIDLTNLLGIDLFVPGNHEFDFGSDIFRQRMNELLPPALAANLREQNGERVPGIEDTKLYEFEGVTIAIIGLTAENSASRSSPGNLQFRNSVDTVKDLAPKLRENGADIVVAVAHAPRRMDFRLMNSGQLDVLLSGDDHDLIVFYDGATAMIEAKQDGEYLTTVDLNVEVEESNGDRKVTWWPKFRVHDTSDVMPDNAVAAKVNEYQTVLSKELDVVVGTTLTKLDSRKSIVRRQEAAIGNLVSDALRHAHDADVALFNGGGIRGNRTYNPGNMLTRRDIRTELPFGNKAVLLELSGEQLLTVLENGLWYAGKANGRFLHVSGLKIVADSNKPPGQKVITAHIDGKMIDPVATYTVSTNSFIASGREGFDVMREAKILLGVNDGDLVSNLVTKYIMDQQKITPRVEGRIAIK